MLNVIEERQGSQWSRRKGVVGNQVREVLRMPAHIGHGLATLLALGSVCQGKVLEGLSSGMT